MLQLSNSAAQTLAAGQTLTFDLTLLRSGCAECHRQNSGLVTLRASNAVYEAQFSANVTGDAGDEVQLSILLDGEPLPETAMVTTIAADGDIYNVATSALFRTLCGCCGRLSVANTGTTDVTVQANASFNVQRKG